MPLMCSQQLPAGTTILDRGPLPAGEIEIVHGVLCNTSANAVTVSVSLVPGWARPTPANRVISEYSLAAGDSLALADLVAGARLGLGDVVAVTVDTADAVNVALSGQRVNDGE